MAPPPQPHVYFIEEEEIYDISSIKAAENAIPADLVWKPKREEWLVVGCLSLVSLVVSLDATILVTALPEISNDLHATAAQASWIGTSYLLTSAVFQPIIVSLSDLFGRRQLLFLSISLFTLGTIICCSATNITQLLIGRCIQGIGGGGIVTLAQVILTDIIPLRQRPTFIGVIQGAWAVGTVTGPLFGGAIAQNTTWRWIFYLNFPICGAGLIMTLLVVKLKAPRVSTPQLLLEFDWIGGFLFVSSTCSFLIGLVWGGSEFPWDSWHTLVPIVFGAIGVVATVVWEIYGTASPFLPLSTFRNVSSVMAYFGAFIQGLLLFCLLYYVPIYFQVVKNFSPVVTGVAMLPVTCVLLPASAVVGALMRKYGVFRPAIWAGWLITIISSGLLSLLDMDIKTSAWVLILMVVGLGHGLVLMAVGYSIQAVTDPAEVAYATAMYTFVRSFGMCIGVVVGAVVFQNRIETELTVLKLPADAAEDPEGFVTVLKALSMDSSIRQNYNLVYSRSIETVFLVLMVFAILGGLTSLLIRHTSTDVPLKSQHKLEKKNIERQQV